MLFLLCGTLALGSVAVSAQLADPLANRARAAVRDYAHFTIFDDVEVAVANRTIILSGRVTMPFKRQELGGLIEKLDGVQSVQNDIQILPVSPQDSQLRQQIARAIYDHPTFWRYASMSRPPIHIVVENRRVTLTGSVGSEIERALAYTLAQGTSALEVTNKLRIESR